MSETVDIQTQPKPARDNAKDKRTLAQVEKWMEMIREISREHGQELIDLQACRRLMTAFHFSVSVFRNFRNSSGDELSAA